MTRFKRKDPYASGIFYQMLSETDSRGKAVYALVHKEDRTQFTYVLISPETMEEDLEEDNGNASEWEVS